MVCRYQTCCNIFRGEWEEYVFCILLHGSYIFILRYFILFLMLLVIGSLLLFGFSLLYFFVYPLEFMLLSIFQGRFMYRRLVITKLDIRWELFNWIITSSSASWQKIWYWHVLRRTRIWMRKWFLFIIHCAEKRFLTIFIKLTYLFFFRPFFLEWPVSWIYGRDSRPGWWCRRGFRICVHVDPKRRVQWLYGWKIPLPSYWILLRSNPKRSSRS